MFRAIGVDFVGILACVLFALAPATAQGSQKQYTVTIADMRYGAIPPDIRVGDTIVWNNRDNVQHTVTARDRSFDLRVGPNRQVRMAVTKAGRFAIYCIYHPAMRSELNVAP